MNLILGGLTALIGIAMVLVAAGPIGWVVLAAGVVWLWQSC